MSDSVRLHRCQPTRLPHPWDSPGRNTGVGCHFLLQRMKVKSESEVAPSCPTLSNPMDCSLPGSSIHGIFQARVLEWGAIAFSGCTFYGFRKCTVTYIHYYSIIESCFTALKILCALFISPSPTPSNHQFFTVLIVLPFPECHAVGIWKGFSN